MTNTLAGNTNPSINPFWGRFRITDDGKRRPATLKTGTNNDAKDLNAYGYIAAPSKAERADGEYALAVGAWNGNSDNSLVSTPQRPLFSIDVTTHVWQGFLDEATTGWSINSFKRPDDGLVVVAVDPWTGLRAAPGGESVEELFIVGTEPTANVRQDDRAARPCSRSRASRSSTTTGCGRTRAGWRARSAGRACAAAPRTPGPPTS